MSTMFVLFVGLQSFLDVLLVLGLIFGFFFFFYVNQIAFIFFGEYLSKGGRLIYRCTSVVIITTLITSW